MRRLESSKPCTHATGLGSVATTFSWFNSKKAGAAWAGFFLMAAFFMLPPKFTPFENEWPMTRLIGIR
jgi:hypothetical protein